MHHHTQHSQKSTPPPTIIAMLWGLDRRPEQLHGLQAIVQARFPQARTLIIEEAGTLEAPISQQAANLLAQLQHYIAGTQASVVLIGHSQGGLRGHALLRTFGNQIDVKCLVTIATPWEGAPIVMRPVEELLEFIALIRRSKLYAMVGLANKIGGPVPYVPPDLIAQVLKERFRYMQDAGHRGLGDMKPNSPFLQETAKRLPHNTTPVLAVAGGPSSLVDAGLPQASGLLRRWADYILEPYTQKMSQLIGDQEHDLLIPVYSQLARHVAKGAPLFFRHLVPGAIHGHARNNKLRSALQEHPQAVSKILAFIESHGMVA